MAKIKLEKMLKDSERRMSLLPPVDPSLPPLEPMEPEFWKKLNSNRKYLTARKTAIAKMRAERGQSG